MGEDRSGIYSIGAVARMVGLPPATLRNWEDRYGEIRPFRSPGGQRLFSRDEVERLRFLARRVAAGESPTDAHRMLRERLDAGRGLDTEDREHRTEVVILLAERDPLAAELAEFFLRTEGYGVRTALGAEEARAALGDEHPDLVIIDMLVPGGGADLCGEFARAGVPAVIAVSTLATEQQALEAGADAFMIKPLDPLRLVSTVRDLLATSAMLAHGGGDD